MNFFLETYISMANIPDEIVYVPRSVSGEKGTGCCITVCSALKMQCFNPNLSRQWRCLLKTVKQLSSIQIA